MDLGGFMAIGWAEEVDVSIFDEAHHLNEPRMRVLTERRALQEVSSPGSWKWPYFSYLEEGGRHRALK